jgi:hypothetical protein
VSPCLGGPLLSFARREKPQSHRGTKKKWLRRGLAQYRKVMAFQFDRAPLRSTIGVSVRSARQLLPRYGIPMMDLIDGMPNGLVTGIIFLIAATLWCGIQELPDLIIGLTLTPKARFGGHTGRAVGTVLLGAIGVGCVVSIWLLTQSVFTASVLLAIEIFAIGGIVWSTRRRPLE